MSCAFTSGSGLVRYRLGEPLVDRYLEFVAGRCRPNTLRAEFGRREGEVLAQVPHGGGSWLSRAALALPVLSEAAGRLVDPAPRPVALQDPRHGNDPGTQDDRMNTRPATATSVSATCRDVSRCYDQELVRLHPCAVAASVPTPAQNASTGRTRAPTGGRARR